MNNSQNLHLAHTQVVLFRNSFEIYLSGCKGVDGVHCNGCHNPQTWDFKYGKKLDADELVIKCSEPIISSIWILGGEPLDQPKTELFALLYLLNKTKKPLWLFTRFEFDEVEENIKEQLIYLKTGKYIENKPSKHYRDVDLTLASDNQKLFRKSIDKWEELSYTIINR